MITKIKEKDGILMLDNDILQIIVLPNQGGNISSIYYKPQNTEFLFQPPCADYPVPKRGESFEAYAAAGFDDAFPNIDAENIEYKGRKLVYNDHGDIWTSIMKTQISGGTVLLREQNEVCLFEKSIALEGNRLILNYKIKNISDEIYPCFYTMHCLFKSDTDTRVIFPDKTDFIENALESEKFGHKGNIIPCSVQENEIGLSHICAAGYEKFYVHGYVKEGSCGIKYPSRAVRINIEWDNDVLPYLGFWVTAGGFRGDYNFALEPSSGYYDSVSEALKNNKLWKLLPSEEKRFNIAINVSDI